MMKKCKFKKKCSAYEVDECTDEVSCGLKENKIFKLSSDADDLLKLIRRE